MPKTRSARDASIHCGAALTDYAPKKTTSAEEINMLCRIHRLTFTSLKTSPRKDFQMETPRRALF